MPVAVGEPTIPLLLGVMADPIRWQLLTALAISDRRVGELVALTGAPQSLVSYHLAQLRDASLISSRRSSADGRDSYYRTEIDRCGHLFEVAAASLHPLLRVAPASPAGPSSARGRRQRVLFLCTGNSARSQMAEALLETRSGGRIEARSAGSHPKDLHPNAVRVLAERHIDLSGRTSKHLSHFARSRFDRIVTLCDKVKEICPSFPGQPPAVHWSMADPAAGTPDMDASYSAFQRTADEIERRVTALIALLSVPPHPKEPT